MTEQISNKQTIKFSTLSEDIQTKVLELKPRLSDHPDRAIFYCPQSNDVFISMKEPSPHISNKYKMVIIEPQETAPHFLSAQKKQKYLEERVKSVNHIIGEDNLLEFMKFLNSQNQRFGKIDETLLFLALKDYVNQKFNQAILDQKPTSFDIQSALSQINLKLAQLRID